MATESQIVRDKRDLSMYWKAHGLLLPAWIEPEEARVLLDGWKDVWIGERWDEFIRLARCSRDVKVCKLLDEWSAQTGHTSLQHTMIAAKSLTVLLNIVYPETIFGYRVEPVDSITAWRYAPVRDYSIGWWNVSKSEAMSIIHLHGTDPEFLLKSKKRGGMAT